MKKILIPLLSMCFTLLLLEGVYRLVQFQRMGAEPAEFAFWWVDQPAFVYDAELGYRYLPDLSLRLTLTDHLNANVHGNDMHTNNAGHISAEPDLPAKPPGTYRIALIGDSFTASNFNNQPWPDTLQSLLNDDADLLSALDAERIDVINAGMEATGIGQFDEIYRYDAARYDPDLVIVNFIGYDITRRFIWRDTVTVSVEDRDYTLVLSCRQPPVSIDNPACSLGNLFVMSHEFMTDDARIDQMRRDIMQLDRDRRPWFGLYPELLAATIGHQQFDLVPRLVRRHPASADYTDPQRALTVSQEALAAIRADHPDALLLYNPMFHELEAGALPPIADALLAAVPDIVDMRGYLPAADLETQRGWYNLPFDNHFNDAGAAIYAQAVYELIRSRLSQSM